MFTPVTDIFSCIGYTNGAIDDEAGVKVVA